MNSTQPMTTVQTPSRFVLPTCGHAFAATRRVADLGTTAVARERIASQTKGGMGLVPAYVPGTTAWSPPTS